MITSAAALPLPTHLADAASALIAHRHALERTVAGAQRDDPVDIVLR
jgi:hypothetical protein